MSSDKGYLEPFDYAEPRCLLCDEPFGAKVEVKPIPQDRVIAKMDELMSRRDYKGCERHLKYWLEEAILGNDKKGELLVRNEMVGHYRKTGEKENAFLSAEAALKLLDELDFEGSVSSGTTYLNIATAYNAFGEFEKAAECFEKAKGIYESSDSVSPFLLAGLYNNMGLNYVSLEKFGDAYALYDKAIELLETIDNGALETAITYLNIADALKIQKGFENAEIEIFDFLDKAFDCFDDERIERNGYYAFVCEKCAAGFSYYGYFYAADELNERAKKIYERA